MTVKFGSHKFKSRTEAMKKAEGFGCYTVESEKRGIGYIFGEDEIAIINGDGYLRMDSESAESLAIEILSILEDIRDLRRMGVER